MKNVIFYSYIPGKHPNTGGSPPTRTTEGSVQPDQSRQKL